MRKNNSSDKTWQIDPIEKMEIAIKTFEFALRLFHACDKDRINPELLSEKFMVNTGGLGFSLEKRTTILMT